MARKKTSFFNEFTVVGVFAAVIIVGLAFGAFFALEAVKPSPTPVQITAVPTVEDYRAEVRDVTSPFLGQAESVSVGELSDESASALTVLAAKTQERLLGMTVPGSEREAHLSLVLLLDQWKAALKGTDRDIQGVSDRTRETLLRFPWISGN